MRLDVALVERGLARSRSHARQLIDAGQVSISGVKDVKPSTPIDAMTELQVVTDPYVSRAAHKLIHALEDLASTHQRIAPLFIDSARILDAGASTGGFTQVILGRGAAVVYAIDVGHDQLAPVVRQDPRVVVREGLNLRDLTLADVGDQPVDLVVGDVSFISLTLLLDPLFSVLSPRGSALLLVKPQFEVGRSGLDSHGIVRDDPTRIRGISMVVNKAAELGWSLAWQGDSAVPGERGNREVFCLFQRTTIWG